MHQSHPARKQTELGSEASISAYPKSMCSVIKLASLLHPQVSNFLEIYYSGNVPIPTAFQQKRNVASVVLYFFLYH